MNALLGLLGAALLTAPAVTAAATQSVVRLAIVDDSGSMSGDKIRLVRSELAAILHANPPTPDQPFALITFGSSPSPAQVFTDITAAEAAIARLAGNSGGTNIAAGLLRGLAEIQRLGAGKCAVVLLFTDGGDSNARGIRDAEAKLDALFSERRKQGLNQAVYLKQWGAGGADQFAKRLVQSGSADVINGDSVVIRPLILRPQVTVEDVQRLEDQRTVQVRWVAVLQSDERPAAPPRVRVRCVDPSAKGGIESVALVGAPTAANTMTVSSGANPGTHAELRLAFTAAIEPNTSPAALLQPGLVRPAQFDVPVNVPEIRVRNVTTATIEMTEAPRWIDPLILRVRYPARLKFNVKAADPTQNVDRSCSLRITPAPGCHLAEGKETFTLPGPGDYELPLAFEMLPSRTDVPRADLRYALKFTIQPVNLPPHLTFVPAQIEFHESNLRAPDAVLVPVTATADRISRSEWIQLPGVAVTQVDLCLRLAGPVPPNTKLKVAAQKPVRRVDLQPESIRNGDNKLRLRLVTDLQPAPAKNPIKLDLQPVHDGISGVEFRGISLDLLLPGPAPVRLAHVDRWGRPTTTIRAVASDCQTDVTLVLCPTVLGLAPSVSTGNLAARFRTVANQPRITNGDCPLNRAANIRLSLPDRKTPSWIWDELQDIPLVLETASPTPSVLPVPLEVRVLREAPIRRVALRLSIALSLFLVVILAARTVLRLRNRSECMPSFSASENEA